MIDFHKVQIKSDFYDNSKNINDYYFTLNINCNPIKNNIEKNIDINQNEENECINIISKEQKNENYIVYNKNNNSNNPKEKKENKNSSSKFIQNNNNIPNKDISANCSKNFFDEPDIQTNTKEEEPNRFNTAQPIKIEQEKIEKEKIKKEKENTLIMTCVSLILLIKFPIIGILFFFSWMIKKHKKKMIILLVILIILVIFFSTLIYIFYWNNN